MKKVIEVKSDPETGDKYFALEDLVDMLPIEQIKHYKIETREGHNQLVVTFFDENGNQVKPKQF